LDPEQLETVLEGLTSYEAKFTTEMVVPGSITLLDLIDAIPEKRGFFDIGRREITVGRVVFDSSAAWRMRSSEKAWPHESSTASKRIHPSSISSTAWAIAKARGTNSSAKGYNTHRRDQSFSGR